MSLKIEFEPVGRRGECPEGITLLECARSFGVDLVNICGGAGNCGSCQIQILQGSVSPISITEREFISEQKLAEGYRLACCTTARSSCMIRIPAESLTTRQRTQVEGQEIPTLPDPVAKSYILELAPPSLIDMKADSERLSDELAKVIGVAGTSFDFAVLANLSTVIREQNWRVKVIVYLGEIVAVLPADSRPLGVAVDLGTTKIAVYLMELDTGKTLRSRGLMNPQVSYGEDIMTRMSSIHSDSQRARLFQSLVVSAINDSIEEMCSECGESASHIMNMVVVGNTTMHHLFLGLPVRQLGRAPYIPEVSSALEIKARDLGIKISSGAYVHLLPIIAGYVGADHLAMLLASGLQNKDGVALAVDIGTNTEICLANHSMLTSVSTASGPAFEGAQITYGMRAGPGAIERFQIVDGKGRYQTIDNSPAVGICGSGILDVMAQLYQHGIVNQRGKYLEHPGVRGIGKDLEFIISDKTSGTREVTFTQRDVEQLQLAKGAIRTGIEVLLSRQGLSLDDVDEVIIAGAFGTYLDIGSALAIGMFPPISKEKFRQVGNAAGMGAKQALISQTKRNEAKELARRVGYIELAGVPSFMRTFAKAMRFG